MCARIVKFVSSLVALFLFFFFLEKASSRRPFFISWSSIKFWKAYFIRAIKKLRDYLRSHPEYPTATKESLFYKGGARARYSMVLIHTYTEEGSQGPGYNCEERWVNELICFALFICFVRGGCFERALEIFQQQMQDSAFLVKSVLQLFKLLVKKYYVFQCNMHSLKVFTCWKKQVPWVSLCRHFSLDIKKYKLI